MALKWYSTVIDCADVAAQGRWWAQTLGWRIVFEDDNEVAIVPSDFPVRELDAAEWTSVGPALVFVPVPEGKSIKNRLHIDLAPHTTDDRDALIADLVDRGARRVDVGQDPDACTWAVLADPEGNEFCVLSARTQ